MDFCTDTNFLYCYASFFQPYNMLFSFVLLI